MEEGFKLRYRAVEKEYRAAKHKISQELSDIENKSWSIVWGVSDKERKLLRWFCMSKSGLDLCAFEIKSISVSAEKKSIVAKFDYRGTDMVCAVCRDSHSVAGFSDHTFVEDAKIIEYPVEDFIQLLEIVNE